MLCLRTKKRALVLMAPEDCEKQKKKEKSKIDRKPGTLMDTASFLQLVTVPAPQCCSVLAIRHTSYSSLGS